MTSGRRAAATLSNQTRTSEKSRSARGNSFDQHRRHQQVFGRELELRSAHHFDVAQILTRELRHRNVENVDILLANKIQEQVQRTLEGFEENLERFRWNVQIVRHLQQWLAIDARDRSPRRLRKIDDRCDRGGLTHV